MNDVETKLLEEQFIKNYSLLYRFAYSALQDEHLAEEAVQETFFIACKKPDAIADSINAKNWLFFTLKNVISNMRKSRAYALNLLTNYLSADDPEAEIPDPAAVNWEIEFYPLSQSKEFQLLKAFAVDKKSISQLAQELGISVAACKKRIERAKNYLQKNI